MNKPREQILKGIDCCAEFLCGECPYKEWEDQNYKLKCNHKLLEDI